MLELLYWLTIAPMALGLSGCQRSETEAPPRPPPTVTVATPVVKQIVEWDAYTGRLEAIEFVEIRARVSGYLEAIYFDEGELVEAGDLLFAIDSRPFVAAKNRSLAELQQAKSQLAQARAQYGEAEAQQLQSDAQRQLAETRVRRARSLRPNDAVSQEELDQREADFTKAEADVQASKARISVAEAAIATAEAAVESAAASVATAELDLSYTQIEAPVSGRISRRYVTEGNLISGGAAGSTLLTTITSVDPIHCLFDASEQEVLKYVRLARAGARGSSRDVKNPVYLALADEQGFPHKGHMDFVNNRFDEDTGTLEARCIFPNDEHILVPGMFARIRIPGSAAYEAVLIPDEAVGTDQASQYVYVVVDGKIEQRPVELGPMVDGLRVVRAGLAGDEPLVIEGLLQARPGVAVDAKQGSIDVVDDGLPDEYEPLPPDQWLSPAPDERPAETPPAAEAPQG